MGLARQPTATYPVMVQWKLAVARGGQGSVQDGWEQFYETLTPSDIEHWHRSQDGARERAERLGWS